MIFNRTGVSEGSRRLAGVFALLLPAWPALLVDVTAQVGHKGGTPAALADFNRDGKLDLVWSDGQGARVFLGNGDGTFTFLNGLSGGAACSGGEIGGVVTRDLNGDGKADFALMCVGSTIAQVVVFLGNGDGTFRAPEAYGNSTMLPGGGTLLAGDLNGDGKPDLVATGVTFQGSNTMVSFLNSGKGTFVQTQQFLPGSIANSLLADLNGDGHLDLVNTRGDSNVQILSGKGDGTFLKYGPQYPMTKGMNSIALADFNGDGKADLLACGYTSSGSPSNAYALAFGQSGGFGPPQVINGSPAGLCTGIAVADFNGDGKLDFALSGWYTPGQSAQLSVFMGKGDGTFQLPVEYGQQDFLNQSHLLVGDLNGDGKPDIVIVEAFYTALNNGDGTFTLIPNKL
jgi:hypothetical protein